MAKTMSEINSPEIDAAVLEAFLGFDLDKHENVQTFFEHDQWHVQCLPCGAQWSVSDGLDGFDFELISDGDDSCTCREEDPDEEDEHQPDCYYGADCCTGELWECETCHEEYCEFHFHQTEKGHNVECVACERVRKEAAEAE